MAESKPLQQISRDWKVRLLLKVIAWVLLLFGFVLSMSWILGFNIWIFAIGLLAGTIVVFREWRKAPGNSDIVRLVNEQFQSSEYSTELVFKTAGRNLQGLQRQKVLNALSHSLPRFRYPVYWKDLLLTLGGMTVILVISWFTVNQPVTGENPVARNINMVPSNTVDKDTIYMSDYEVRLAPPAYTGLKARRLEDLNIVTEEQSRIEWNLHFNGDPESVWLKLGSGDSLAFSQLNDGWHLGHSPAGNELYTLNHLDINGQTITTSYFKIELIPDTPPEVDISGVPPFQRLSYRQGLQLNMHIQMSDDYQLTDGFIVATITKGSGESVKFREQQIKLAKTIRGKQTNSNLSLNLDDFGMEPGNELYFYATAFDNHSPERQQSRTETYFFVLEDTATVEFSLQGALGIDLMPDYFRSQLQIILDTEKLIREKEQLSDYDFNFASNALGYDQKQLRLKYGQFIGDEADSGLEIEEEEDPAEGMDTSEENIVAEFGHDTDHENEEGQLMDKGTEPSPLDEFLHLEDDEAVGFYSQSLKAKLRAALNEMWDSELQLRLYKPALSLPYQYRAQELLKDIRNHARIYVQRIGFEPPPVNETESRLTGELKELNNRPFIEKEVQETNYPAIRAVIILLDDISESTVWSDNMKQMLELAGDELASLAIEFPGLYLQTLNNIRSLIELESLTPQNLIQARKVKIDLIQALPTEIRSPSPAKRTDDQLTREFIDNLISIQN